MEKDRACSIRPHRRPAVMSWDSTRPHHHRSFPVDKTRHAPGPASPQPKPCNLRPVPCPRPPPGPAQCPRPTTIPNVPAAGKTLSAPSWCLMPNNQAAGPTAKIAVESPFRIRPQTCSPSAGDRLFTFPSLPCHAVLCFLQRV